MDDNDHHHLHHGVEAPTQAPPPTPTPAPPDKPSTLPPLSTDEFRIYNRMAEKMDYFHNHFRQTWTMLHTACSAGRRPQHMKLREFIDEGLGFCRLLSAHHQVEESYLFPMLAQRMPEFQQPGTTYGPPPTSTLAGQDDAVTQHEIDDRRSRLVQHHRDIHAGMDQLESYLAECRAGKTELNLAVMLQNMNTWGTVLWTHLDEEVKVLGAENMRRYWTVDEVRGMGL